MEMWSPLELVKDGLFSAGSEMSEGYRDSVSGTVVLGVATLSSLSASFTRTSRPIFRRL